MNTHNAKDEKEAHGNEEAIMQVVFDHVRKDREPRFDDVAAPLEVEFVRMVGGKQLPRLISRTSHF